MGLRLTVTALLRASLVQCPIECRAVYSFQAERLRRDVVHDLTAALQFERRMATYAAQVVDDTASADVHGQHTLLSSDFRAYLPNYLRRCCHRAKRHIQ